MRQASKRVPTAQRRSGISAERHAGIIRPRRRSAVFLEGVRGKASIAELCR